MIRKEQFADQRQVHAINLAAFGLPGEADLVDVLREQASPVVSLVAEEAAEVVGHILFSPVSLAGHPELKLMGLAPMSVLPKSQNSGIGSALVGEGLEQCRKLGIEALVVLGHSRFYPRFGFVPSVEFGLDSHYEVAPEVFMAMELTPGALAAVSGSISYHAAFAEL